ncbi:hypothetical protein ACS0TY_005864 [Phlomoides rotata]
MNSGSIGNSSNGFHQNNRSGPQLLGDNECERVRIIREWAQMNSQQRNNRELVRDGGVEAGSQIEQVRDGLVVAHPEIAHSQIMCCLAGSLVEQLWNFAWPAAIALIHHSLLHVAVIGFFAKLTIIVGGPLVGKLMDYFPRVPTYNCLTVIQVAAQLLSAGMIIHAHTIHPNYVSDTIKVYQRRRRDGEEQKKKNGKLFGLGGTLFRLSLLLQNPLFDPLCLTVSFVLVQPWFVVLVITLAVERLSGLALGVAMERDWVVLLAGTNRPIALAQANAILNLLCEMAGASLFGIFLSKYETVMCLKLAARLMMCSLLILVVLTWLTNTLSAGVLGYAKCPHTYFGCLSTGSIHDAENIFTTSIEATKHGWFEYIQQPILPASLAYVLLYFNVALAPGGLMTAFLTQHGNFWFLPLSLWVAFVGNKFGKNC